MAVAERTRERSKVYVGAAIAAIGIAATVTGVVMTTAQLEATASGANLSVTAGQIEGVGPTRAVTWNADERAYEIQLLITGTGSGDTEREARTMSCDITDSAGRVTTVTGADENVQTLINGAYAIGRVEVAAGAATAQCGWAAPTEEDSLRAVSRYFAVVPAPPAILAHGTAVAFTGFVAFLAGGLAVLLGWKRFRATR